MPEKSPTDRIRVKDKDTGYHLTIARMSLPHGNLQELKQDAVDPLTGDDLPPDYSPSDGQSAADKKES